MYSPDGQQIAYLSMATPGYEADTNKIKIFDLQSGARREIATAWDASVDEMCWSSDGSALFCTAQCKGHSAVYKVQLDDVSAGTKAAPTTLVATHANTGVSFVPSAADGGGGRLVFSQSSLCAPAEVFTCLATDGSGLTALSSINASALSSVTMGEVSELICKGAHGDDVQSWLLYPAGFDVKAHETEKYPLAVIVHGGPQGTPPSRFAAARD